MKNFRLKFAWGAAALALVGCGETGSEPPVSRPVAGGVTIELPEPKAPPAPPPVPDQQKADAEPEDEKIEKAPPAVAEPPAKAPEPKEPEAPAAPKAPEASKAETPAPEAAPKSETRTSRDEASPLPLPRAVVTRTIERIGYPCGGVASSARIEAPAGETAYRITCTSGDTYRASDRSGRFRFRKWGEPGE